MKNVLFVVSLFLTTLVFAQDKITISGTVIQDGKKLPNVSVEVLETNQGTITDLDGNFKLDVLPGNYNLKFTYGNAKTVSVEAFEDVYLMVDLSNVQEQLGEVFLSSIKVDADSPITYSNLTKEEIEERNLGQDIPVLMNYLPSVVTTTDAGNGVGYTGIRVRGSDATRTNVTINGIPYNDSESQGSFWVNLGDFASSVENIQLQRGVGTSTNGAGAFGASLNIQTDEYQKEASAEIANSFGSYNTRKHTAKFSTGLINNHFEFSGRGSLIKSDGYIDRAESDLKSYFVQGNYIADNTLIKAIMFSGKERTYQAWYGIDGDQLEEDRTYNPAGVYTDEAGNELFYDNQTDNYQQDHYQLLWNQRLDNNWSTNLAFHYTRGRGYYEEFQEDATLEEYGMQNFTANGEEVTTSDLVNRSWLDNHFYGTVFSVNYKNDKLDAVFGGGWNKYDGDHFGDVIYTRFAQNNEPYEPYYFNNAKKTDFNLYGKATFAISEKLMAFGDLQIRTINYEAEGPTQEVSNFPIDDSFTFFNPKGGLTYQINNQNQLYASVAVAHREPSRSDYEDAFENGEEAPSEEQLLDYELGYRLKKEKFQLNTNLYYMNYENQLVLTGEIDEEGAQIRKNSGNSYRLGLEIDAVYNISEKFTVRPNIALSQNKNRDFKSNFNGELQNFGDTDISFSPSVVAGNIFTYKPLENLSLNLLSKYVGEQYMSNIESETSKLDAYFVNDFNVQYTLKTSQLFSEIVFTGLVNNIFSEEYVSNGYYFSYDDDFTNPGTVTTIEGTGYYPQATRNFLLGVTLKF
ncbi:TonB-dependent receptor domain-containing protein [Mesonia sp. K7]|uniref:TonB-dependent receptor n=1 Tax=Mesonia sp. K7 TaxID=2218606 RepID=UPI000DA826A6|nr:TonB-dependent receptor [Mesonia sp. K7]PZD78940.1 TonB-dependent receptor [Mesonia sp. K7]